MDRGGFGRESQLNIQHERLGLLALVRVHADDAIHTQSFDSDRIGCHGKHLASSPRNVNPDRKNR